MTLFAEISALISGLFKPVAELVDELHTSEEERLAIKARIEQVQAAVSVKLAEYAGQVAELEGKIARAQAEAVVSEASGHSWLQRNWRPLLMMLFGFLIGWNYFLAPVVGVQSSAMPAGILDILKIGIGGYVGFRSIEKIVPRIAAMIGGRR